MRAVLGLALAAVLALAGTAEACPFCTQMGKSLADEVAGAEVVVYGRVAAADEAKETSDIEVEAVLKQDSSKPVGKKVVIQKFLDTNIVTGKDRVLLFCEENKGKLDAYRGLVVKKGSKLPDYVKGSVSRRGKAVSERLKFHFDYLDDEDGEVSADAYKEFANCDYSDFKAMAVGLPAEKVLKWLKDPATPAYRYGLYASMLGHCGKPEHAAELKKIIADPDRRSSGVDGLLAALVMLKPKEGFAEIEAVLKNPKEDFMYRFAALRSLRFLHDYRTELVEKKHLVAAACRLLDQEDIADMAVEDLRKWKAWDVADKVLALKKTKGYEDVTVIKRSVLRYCLQCEGHEGAKALVAERRKEDAEAVKDAEELLALEAETAKPKKAAPKK